MGKRFAIVIGVAAAGVMALGPQTAGARPEVVKYDAKVTIHRIKAGAGPYFHGSVESKVRKCMDGRRVVVFKKRPGADQKDGHCPNAPRERGGPAGGSTSTLGTLRGKIPSMRR